MATAVKHRYTVSGPGVDKTYETAGVALSAAITRAEHHGADASFYVRDFDDSVVARVDHDTDGNTTIYRNGGR